MNNFYYKFLIVLGVIVIIDINPSQMLFLSEIGTAVNNQFTNEFYKYIETENDTIAANIQMKIYIGSSIETANVIDVPITRPEVICQYIDYKKPLVIYIHGYVENPSDESVQTMVGAYLERGTDNIFALDWSKFAYDNYISVISRIKDISRIFTTSFGKLIELGVDIENCHIIGHSLGAQIAGFMWKYMKYSLPRITGLDPASPGFYQYGAEHITSDSARFVDVIHTDGGFYGTLKKTGTVDIYSNGGTRPQPGCESFGVLLSPKDLCSHRRSWRYYAESVNNINAFVATQCDYYSDYIHGKCKNNRKILMGYETPRDTHGFYFLITNDKSPYGRNNHH